jgi:predicted ATPase
MTSTILVTGAGGVGKTTVSAAIAVIASEDISSIWYSTRGSANSSSRPSIFTLGGLVL